MYTSLNNPLHDQDDLVAPPTYVAPSPILSSISSSKRVYQKPSSKMEVKNGMTGKTDLEIRYRQLKALLYKNYLLKVRYPLQSLLEILLPVTFALLIIIIFFFAESKSIISLPQNFASMTLPKLPANYNITQLIENHDLLPKYIKSNIDFLNIPIADYIFTLQGYNGPLNISSILEYYAAALLTPSVLNTLPTYQADEVRSLPRMGNLLYGRKLIITPRNENTTLIINAIIRNLSLDPIDIIDLPGIKTEQEAIDYIQNYEANSNANILAIINFEIAEIATQQYRYSIRMNASSVPETNIFFSSNPLYISFIYQNYILSGFTSIQKMVDSALITLSTNATANLLFQEIPMPTLGGKFNIIYDLNGFIFGILLFFAGLFPISRLLKGLVEEKENKMREIMKIMGLKPIINGLSWFIVYIILFAIVSSLMVFVLFPVFPRTHPLLLYILFFLFFVTEVALAFLVSQFFSQSKFVTIIGPIIYFTLTLPRFAFYFSSDNEFVTAKAITCVFSPSAFVFAIDLIVKRESLDLGLNFDSINEENLSMKTILTVLILDIFLYIILGLIAHKILPNEYEGWVSTLFDFFSFKLSSAEFSESHAHKDILIEIPMDLKTSVRIKNVRKEFKADDGSTKVAIHDMSLEIYENQITALLGHNGAGKSTLIAALTGLVGLTSGDAIVNGKSIKHEMLAVREHYGVCPQHDVLWDVLTVEEHLHIFACLHAWDEESSKQRVDCMIDEVGLNDKRNVGACDLSGGMKRKLSIANAFIGGSKVVLLDEPTSGMDPYSRRFTWNLLRKFTQNRTIIITTHFLDEAELLCDRIAIMSDGKLLCCGSSLFLKSNYGSGYTLNILKLKDSNEHGSKLVTFVDSYVQGCEVLNSSGSEIQFQLPLDEVSKFSKLLISLDNNLVNLGIES